MLLLCLSSDLSATQDERMALTQVETTAVAEVSTDKAEASSGH